ncbi:MAG: hypothetical protein M1814_000061 [Vezdaea aestivalis]|nr:MAG: hypothetical protein M1814_000061 [Vezdaea aestivalis]
MDPYSAYPYARGAAHRDYVLEYASDDSLNHDYDNHNRHGGDLYDEDDAGAYLNRRVGRRALPNMPAYCRGSVLHDTPGRGAMGFGGLVGVGVGGGPPIGPDEIFIYPRHLLKLRISVSLRTGRHLTVRGMAPICATGDDVLMACGLMTGTIWVEAGGRQLALERRTKLSEIVGRYGRPDIRLMVKEDPRSRRLPYRP